MYLRTHTYVQAVFLARRGLPHLSAQGALVVLLEELLGLPSLGVSHKRGIRVNDQRGNGHEARKTRKPKALSGGSLVQGWEAKSRPASKSKILTSEALCFVTVTGLSPFPKAKAQKDRLIFNPEI